VISQQLLQRSFESREKTCFPNWPISSMFKLLGNGFKRPAAGILGIISSSPCSTRSPRGGPIDQPDILPSSHIPPYRPRVDEPVETVRARLLYQSRKRGMLENGLLLSTFAAKFLESMTEPELKDYDRLINLPSNDWDIYYWATGVKLIPTEFDTPMMRKFIAHVQNSDREARFQQPSLYPE